MTNNSLTVKNDNELTMAERFTNKVLAEFQGSVGSEIALTNFQRRLVQNYFMVADMVLKAAEGKRLKKAAKYQDKVPVIWANIDMEKLSQGVVSAARIGWDPTQDNHVSLIPFKDNATQKYSMTFMPGYRGIELKAKKYGLDIPDSVIVELVYSTDKFKSIKKNFTNKYESFDFEITNDFDRGDIIGGFYYHIFSENPEKNKLVVLSKKDIEKRKPKYASAEFWGGERDTWEDGKKTGKETIEGWFDKMCLKTIHRAAYKDITIDSQKIDDDYLKLKQVENEFSEAEVDQTIAENANGNIIDIQSEEITEDVTDAEQDDGPEPHVLEQEAELKERNAQNAKAKPSAGPGF